MTDGDTRLDVSAQGSSRYLIIPCLSTTLCEHAGLIQLQFIYPLKPKPPTELRRKSERSLYRPLTTCESARILHPSPTYLQSFTCENFTMDSLPTSFAVSVRSLSEKKYHENMGPATTDCTQQPLITQVALAISSLAPASPKITGSGKLAPNILTSTHADIKRSTERLAPTPNATCATNVTSVLSIMTARAVRAATTSKARTAGRQTHDG